MVKWPPGDEGVGVGAADGDAVQLAGQHVARAVKPA